MLVVLGQKQQPHQGPFVQKDCCFPPQGGWYKAKMDATIDKEGKGVADLIIGTRTGARGRL